MVTMADALITGGVLKWARERAGTSLDAAADKLKVSVGDVGNWERGQERPSFAQARTLAKFLGIPFGYLFLSHPRQETIAIPDLRRIGGDQPPVLSPSFLAVYHDAKAKQDWLRDYLAQQGAQRLPFVGRYTIRRDPAVVAADIRTVLEITTQKRRACATWEEFLRHFVERAEEAGIIVLRNSIVANNTHRPLSVDEFRGFALSDALAPIVFINSADAKSAQIFTLAHELAHIWINESAISNFGLANDINGYDPIEVFSNRVAAELLVPRDEFLASWRNDVNLDTNATSLAREFRVSALVIARRALDLGMIARNSYLQFYRDEMARFRDHREKQAEKEGGPDFYRSLKARNSALLSRLVVTEALEGRLLMRDAGRLLSIRPARLRDFAKELER